LSQSSPLSPAERARRAEQHSDTEENWFARLNVPQQAIEVTKRTAVGVYTDGFAHAGNFAYMSLLAVFSFFIAVAAIITTFGDSVSGRELLNGFFATVPPSVREALREPIEVAMNSRSGALLWFSGIVGLWTTASLIENFRDIINRAYGTTPERYFWQYRLGSIFGIIGAIFLTMLIFSAQILLSAIEEVIFDLIPASREFAAYIRLGQLIPFFGLFGAIYLIFRGLTPRQFRSRRYKKWPGSALVSLWWLGCTSLLPVFIGNVADYDLTYGSLAGVMITLIFFYIIGLGLVTGAQLNAALANGAENGIKHTETEDDNRGDGNLGDDKE